MLHNTLKIASYATAFLLIVIGLLILAGCDSNLQGETIPIVTSTTSSSPTPTSSGTGTTFPPPQLSAKWSRQQSNSSSALRAVAWSGKQFVAVGVEILTSPDGVTWTSQAPPPAPPEAGTMYDVIWTGTQFVAVGETGGGHKGAVITSTDGVTWTYLTSLSDPANKVAWSGSIFAATSVSPYTEKGCFFTFDDEGGASWSRTAVSSTWLDPIVWSGTQFVAAGGENANPVIIYTSPDGSSWTTQLSNITDVLNDLVWTGKQFVAVGYNGAIFTSTDAITWTRRTSGTAQDLFNVAWSGTQFTAVGRGGVVATSPDGITWTVETVGDDVVLVDIAWSGEKFVAVGTKGAIFTSP